MQKFIVMDGRTRFIALSEVAEIILTNNTMDEMREITIFYKHTQTITVRKSIKNFNQLQTDLIAFLQSEEIIFNVF